MAISTYATTFKYGATSATTEIKIKDFPSVTGQRSALETTTTSDDARTYIQGIFDTPESFEFTCNYDSAVLSTINALTAAQKCELEFGDGAKYTWDGYISASVNEGGVDEVLEMTITVTPSTVPVFTAAGN